MTSKVEICNMALGHCKAGSITDIDEASNEAQQCSLYYDTARQFVLESAPWKFTTKVKVLALHVEVPVEWQYSYAYPSDALQIRRLLSDAIVAATANDIIYRLAYWNIQVNTTKNYKVPYEVGLNNDDATAIWTNEPDAWVAYTVNQEDTVKFPSAFVTGFAHYLASLIAVPIAGRAEGREIASDNLNLYQNAIINGISNNQIEKYSGPQPESDMITVRN